jgi:NAD(P)-dependent dehydrogenase (short-subunit alcohol dehydrogenase family)
VTAAPVPGRLSGRVVLVTGGGGDIGSRTAARCASEGAAVVLADLNAATAQAAADRVVQAGGRALAVELDVTDEASYAAAVAAATDAFGPVDVLHNNAAAAHMYTADHGVLDTDPSTWDTVLRVNLLGIVLGCRAVLPGMLALGRGSIVNMSSTRAAGGADDLIAYSASKAAVESVTRSVATAHGRDGVRCNAIAPGVIATAGSRGLHGTAMEGRFLPHLLTTAIGTEDDIAAAVAYLASDDARYVTGQVLRVDGGLLSHQPTMADQRR